MECQRHEFIYYTSCNFPFWGSNRPFFAFKIDSNKKVINNCPKSALIPLLLRLYALFPLRFFPHFRSACIWAVFERAFLVFLGGGFLRDFLRLFFSGFWRFSLLFFLFFGAFFRTVFSPIFLIFSCLWHSFFGAFFFFFFYSCSAGNRGFFLAENPPIFF